MRFIVDESTGTAVAEFLRAQGHEVLVVAEAMPRADDVDILARALSEQRILVTNDKDFGELVFARGLQHSGILLLRLGEDRPDVRVHTVRSVLALWADRLGGAFTVASEAEVRIRPANRPP